MHTQIPYTIFNLLCQDHSSVNRITMIYIRWVNMMKYRVPAMPRLRGQDQFEIGSLV